MMNSPVTDHKKLIAANLFLIAVLAWLFTHPAQNARDFMLQELLR